MTYLMQALIACVATALCIVWMRRPAERLGLIDLPGGRKRHGTATPITGGLAITISLFCALSLSLPSLGNVQVLLVAIALLAGVGLLDDRGAVGSQAKLGAQLFAALLMTSWGGHYLHTLGDLFGAGPVQLRDWSIPLTLFATVAVINAINTFDGLDGLAGALVLVMLGFFAFFAWTLGDANALKFLVVLMGAVIGFLFFNAPVAWRGPRTFMGDTGSQVLGIVVAWFAIDLAQPRAGNAPPPVVMLWVVGVVLLDFFTITVRRVLRRRNPAAPDRAHIHHLLVRRGFTPTQVVVLLTVVNTLFGAVGTAGWLLGLEEQVLFAAFFGVGVLYLALFLLPASFMRLGRRRGRATLRKPVLAIAASTHAARKPATLERPHPAATLDPAARPGWRAGSRRAPRRGHANDERPRPPLS